MPQGQPFDPRVSVCVISYNHAPFVEPALRSVLAQITPFPFEIVFADDCSPDGTLKLAERVAAEASVPFRFLPRTHNLGPRANFLDLLAETRGEYVAYLEADDYWVDSARLAEQVALLDAHPELSGCFGKANVVDASDRVLSDFFDHHGRRPPATEIDQRMVVQRGSVAPACTMVFRRSAILDLPPWYLKDGSHQGLSVILTSSGKLKYVEKVWGHYRVHPGGTWSAASEEHKCVADYRYAVGLASDPILSQAHTREIGRRLALATFALCRQRLRRPGGLAELPGDLRPAVSRTALRSVVWAIPELARLTARRVAGARR
ncbi:MAG TPA: glycosyltransferase [Polyangiaceae bacterium]|nr:glycosyltransferase [Polyangiaceae bacterium]